MGIFKKLLCAVGVLLFIFSCGKDAYDFGAGEGSASFQVAADYATSVVGTKAEGDLNLDINEFALEIFNSLGVKLKKEKYGDIKDQKIRMNEGSFTAQAYFGDSTATGFDAIYFAGKRTFSVQGQSTTPVSIICKMANVKVAVQWGEIIQQEYSDYSVKIYREGNNGELLFTKSETRCGYIPAGNIKMDISLTDAGGTQRMYSPKVIACKSNDFITFIIDTKEAAKEEVTVSFQLVADTDNKTETVIIPASLVAKEAPSVETVGFTDNAVSFVEGVGTSGDLQLRISAPGFIEKCEMVSDSDFLPGNWPEQVDLLDADGNVLDMIMDYGITWSMDKGMDKYGIIDLKEFAKKIRAVGDNVSTLKFLITDVKGQKKEVEYTFNVEAVTLEMKSVPDYDMWATKAYVEIVTNAADPSVFAIESANSDAADAFATCQAIMVSRTGDVSRFEITGLTPGTTYNFRANYCNGFKYTNVVSGTTEIAQQLSNGGLESWSKTEIHGGNGTFDGKIECDFVADWSTRNEKTTLGAKDATMGVLGIIGGNFGVNWRWCSNTLPTTDAVSGNAAEISTIAFYNDKVTGAWSRDDVYTSVRDNGTAYVGYLFLGTFNKDSDSYTLGVSHTSRPLSVEFWYKYTPCTGGDKCFAYAVVYDADKNEIARSSDFTSSGADVYTKQILNLDYGNNIKAKAAYITIFFKSGESTDISKMTHVQGDYSPSPFCRDKIVGSVLKVDNVTLNY